MINIISDCTFGGFFYLETRYIEYSRSITLFFVCEYLAQFVRQVMFNSNYKSTVGFIYILNIIETSNGGFLICPHKSCLCLF